MAVTLEPKLIASGITRAVMTYQLGRPFVYSEGPGGAAFDYVDHFRSSFVQWRLPKTLAYTMNSNEWFPVSREHSIGSDHTVETLFPVSSIFGGCGPYISDSLEFRQLVSILGNPNHPNLKLALAKKFMKQSKRAFMKQHHPDSNPNSDACRFSAFVEAWDWLKGRIDSKRLEDVSVSSVEGWPAYWSWSCEDGWIPPLADPSDELQIIRDFWKSLEFQREQQWASISEILESLFS